MAIHLSSISSTFFINLLNRLGVKPPPPDGFDLVNTVQPVSIVDQDVTLAVNSSSMLLDTPFSQGALLTPAAGTLLADTGAQPGGTYQVFCVLSFDGGSNTSPTMELARRNAANNADIWQFYANCNSGASMTLPFILEARITLGVNERLIFRVGAAALAAGTVKANIWLAAG